MPKKTNSFLHFIFDLVQSFVIALVIFIVVYNFIAQPHRVRGDSMLPNFHDDEYLLTEKLSYQFGEPKRGDVVVLHYPENPAVDFIKRIIALPGETILVRNGSIFINGQELTEPYLPNSLPTTGSSKIQEGKEFVIPENEYVVMGDNRTKSSDSRTWGTVPENMIIGKAFFVYWPINNFGIVGTANAQF